MGGTFLYFRLVRRRRRGVPVQSSTSGSHRVFEVDGSLGGMLKHGYSAAGAAPFIDNIPPLACSHSGAETTFSDTFNFAVATIFHKDLLY